MRRPTVRAAPAAGADRTDGLPLAGVRVLDFTAFLAGPMATQYLASLGADVIKVESIQRPDPMRFSVRVDPSVDQWYEQGGIFQSVNLNKRSVTLNLSVARGRELLLRLAAGCDVVVENFTPRVMEQFGLTYDDFRRPTPTSSWCACPASASRARGVTVPGFAATMEQVSGMAWITGYGGRDPEHPRHLRSAGRDRTPPSPSSPPSSTAPGPARASRSSWPWWTWPPTWSSSRCSSTTSTAT